MMLSSLKKVLFTSTTFLLCLGGILSSRAALAAEELPGKGRIVQPAVATWSSGFFLEALFSRGLKELGYTVMHPKMLSNPIFYRAVAQGEVDFWANGWFPLHESFLVPGWEKEMTILGMIARRGGVQGYLVSKREADRYGITSLDDFKRAEVREAFDTDGDGKADLVSCTPGWQCAKVIAFHLNVYHLKEDIKMIEALYDASMAAALARYQEGKPIFFYTWMPNWTLYRLKPGKDVVWINVPEIIPYPTQEGLEKFMVARGLKGAVTDPCKMGFVANDIRVVANNKFLDQNPAIRTLFSQITIPLEDLAQQSYQMYEGKNKRGDIAKAVDQWIAENRKTWNGWLEEAKKSAKPSPAMEKGS